VYGRKVGWGVLSFSGGQEALKCKRKRGALQGEEVESVKGETELIRWNVLRKWAELEGAKVPAGDEWGKAGGYTKKRRFVGR